jgi:hypothetical protein
VIAISTRFPPLPARRAAACLPFFLTIAACVTPIGSKDLLTFLENEPVTEGDVYVRLGAPSATFENRHVYTYRLHRDKDGYITQPYRRFDTDWEDINYDLVLVFDENGVLRQHNLVAIRPP